ncbi:MAG: hypothetical protein WAU77_10540 [Solirubrobacteraceae bacterium]
MCDPLLALALGSLFTRGERLWCGLGLYELVAAIECRWDEPVELKTFFAIAHAGTAEVLSASSEGQ